ncbi:MAG: chromosomal replication initiator protein DnaA [Defluviitaleaceae bacterium]|nr:chromosomal replication initiator protein DnaA [Defluviitaleaceae bacterium]
MTKAKITASELWEQTINELAETGELSDIGYNAWLSNVTPVSFDGNNLDLLAADEYVKETIENRYLKKIDKITAIKLGRKIIINIDHRRTGAADVTADSEYDDENTSTPPAISPQQARTKNSHINNTLIRRYTFDTFVKGKHNELAFGACRAVAENPGVTSYNPLFLYGGVGLGKTHLMHAIGNYVTEFDKNLNVIYVTSEDFVNDFVAAIRADRPQKFREKYRDVDVLMVDDVQFLVNKILSQEEFFNTFNALFHTNKQIVLSSDKPPSHLTTLEERLTSRFGSGLVVDISLPDYETRLAILEKKAEKEKIHIPNEILRHLAANIDSNIRVLEGAYNQIIARAKLTNTEVNINLAYEALKDISNTAAKTELNIPHILKFIADKYVCTPDELRSKKRTANLSHARQVAMFITRKILNCQLTSIGKELGDRDHSTVLHGINRITELLETDKKLQAELEVLEEEIRHAAK